MSGLTQNSVSFTTDVVFTTLTLPTPLSSTTIYVVVVPQQSTTLTMTTTHTNIVTLAPTTLTAVISVPIASLGSHSFASSSFATSTTPSSTASSSIDTPTLPSQSITIFSKPASDKSTAILIGVLVPIGLILAGSIFFFVQEYRKSTRTKDLKSQSIIKHAPTQDVEMYQPSPRADESNEIKTAPARTPLPPPLPIAPVSIPPAIPARSPLREMSASPPRPLRPGSISNSVLGFMSRSPTTSYRAETASEYEGSPEGMQAGRDPKQYDGTRTKFYKTALEHNLPFDQLTRPSLRISKGHAEVSRSSSVANQPLRVHKRNASEETGFGKKNPYVTNLEAPDYPDLSNPSHNRQEVSYDDFQKYSGGQVAQPNSAAGPELEQQFENVHEEGVDLNFMRNRGSVRGSFINDDERNWKRQNTLRQLEGSSPIIMSTSSNTQQTVVAGPPSNVSTRGSTSYFDRSPGGRDEYFRDWRGVVAVPLDVARPRPRNQSGMPDELIASRRQGEVIDDAKVEEWREEERRDQENPETRMYGCNGWF